MILSDHYKARFFAKVDRNGPIPAHCPELGPCHVWTAKETVGGYGRIRIGGRKSKKILVHRLAFFIAHGRWPEPECCHHCDNTKCVNVSHLFEGTHTDNMRDCCAKKRSNKPTGDAHFARRNPERLARGDRSGARKHPERYPRGDDSYFRKHPEMVLRGENHGSAKLTEQRVRDIVASLLLCRVSKEELGRRYGVTGAMVGRIARGQAWAHVTGIGVAR